MDKNTAREIIRTAFRSGRELEALLVILKDKCTAEEYSEFLRATAAAIDQINIALTEKALKRFPDLKNEIEANLDRTGQAMP